MSNIILVNAEAGRIPLPSAIIHSHCTSPPYWRLRNYSGQKEEEEDPQRRYWPQVTYRPGPGLPEITVPAGMYALGMEPTPELFIAHLVLVYRQVYRVTREDSCGWCVIGDCFWDSNKRRATRQVRPLRRGEEDGQLLGIPGMLWKALQADGWYVRNDVCWFKKSPMPESVQGTRWERHRIKVKTSPMSRQGDPAAIGGWETHGDDIRDRDGDQWTDCPGCPACEPHGGFVLRRGSWRHTRAHETILMLAKRMNYFCDQEAVREKATWEPSDDWMPNRIRNVGGRTDGFTSIPGGIPANPSGRNPRSVLSPSPSPYSGAHYATFPPDLIRPLIRASCPARCCPVCGAGWAAVVERERTTIPVEERHGRVGHNGQPPQQSGWFWKEPKSEVLEYRPSCACRCSDCGGTGAVGPDMMHLEDCPNCDGTQMKPIPGLVLDPFVGSGTTLEVAREEGLRGIGCDLSFDYLAEQARERLGFVALDEWQNGKDGSGEPLNELPLFAGLEREG